MQTQVYPRGPMPDFEWLQMLWAFADLITKPETVLAIAVVLALIVCMRRIARKPRSPQMHEYDAWATYQQLQDDAAARVAERKRLDAAANDQMLHQYWHTGRGSSSVVVNRDWSQR